MNSVILESYKLLAKQMQNGRFLKPTYEVEKKHWYYGSTKSYVEKYAKRNMPDIQKMQESVLLKIESRKPRLGSNIRYKKL